MFPLAGHLPLPISRRWGISALESGNCKGLWVNDWWSQSWCRQKTIALNVSEMVRASDVKCRVMKRITRRESFSPLFHCHSLSFFYSLLSFPLFIVHALYTTVQQSCDFFFLSHSRLPHWSITKTSSRRRRRLYGPSREWGRRSVLQLAVLWQWVKPLQWRMKTWRMRWDWLALRLGEQVGLTLLNWKSNDT